MEYYILWQYQSRKKNDLKVEREFDGLGSISKKIVIVCFVIMFTSFLEMIVTMMFFPKQFWYLIGVILCIVAVLVLWGIDNKHQKKHMDQYEDLHQKKLEILEEVLEGKGIRTKEKVEELINIYQDYLDGEENKEKKRNRIILALASAFAGVLSITFENMGLIGMDFVHWMYFATFLLILVAAAGIWIYFYAYFDPLKRQYELMIRDLKELLLIKY